VEKKKEGKRLKKLQFTLQNALVREEATFEIKATTDCNAQSMEQLFIIYL